MTVPDFQTVTYDHPTSANVKTTTGKRVSETAVPTAHRQRASLRAGRRRAGAALAGAVLLSGCSDVSSLVKDARTRLVGAPNPYQAGYVGDVVADEPRAAMAARDVLARGGNAADAATTLALALSVTLPSRASLGGGGVCLARDARSRTPRAFQFLPHPGTGTQADRPAAVPMLLRGIVAMQAAQGHVQFRDLVQPATNLARQGVQVSKALADDLAVVATPLLADAQAASVFGNGQGGVLAIGDTLVQPQLAATLDGIARGDGTEMYTGALGLTFAAAADDAHAGITAADLRAAVPQTTDPLTLADGATTVSFAPDAGGTAAAAQYGRLQSGGAVSGAGGVLPASTSFVVTDAQGGAVACALTMDNLFGNGRIAPGTGIVMAASPASHPLPLLPAAIAQRGSAPVAVVAASGQADAAAEAASALYQAVHGGNAASITPATAQGRANVIACPNGTASSCTVHTDQRGAGLALTSG